MAREGMHQDAGTGAFWQGMGMGMGIGVEIALKRAKTVVVHGIEVLEYPLEYMLITP
jgi:hypothetical protein